MTQDYYGIIYCAENKINNKKYIGQTTKSMDIRKNNHIQQSKYKENLKGDTTFYKAIRKYGEDNFNWETIDYTESQEELDSKEIYWIDFFNTYKQDGYNMTLGGQNNNKKYIDINDIDNCNCNSRFSRKLLVYDKLGNYIKTTVSQTAFAEETAIKVTNINRVLKGNKNSIGDFILFYEDEFTMDMLNKKLIKTRNTREFALFDAKTKECYGIWDNQTRCFEDTKFSRRMILKQLNEGIKSTARKFIARYVKDCENEYLENLSIYLNK